MRTFTISPALTIEEAMALAQFVKRIGWQEIRINAAGDAEARLMRDAISKIQDDLTEKGFAPR